MDPSVSFDTNRVENRYLCAYEYEKLSCGVMWGELGR